MAQEQDLAAQIHRLMAAGASDDDIVFYIQNHNKVQPAPSQETPSEPTVKPVEEKTLSGFMDNVITSGKEFATGTAKGLYSIANLVNDLNPAMVATNAPKIAARAEQAKQLVQNAPAVAAFAGNQLKNRYGGLQQIEDTLYKDPVGVLGDIATVASLGSLAAETQAPRVASVLSKVEQLTNPLGVVPKVAARVGSGLEGAARVGARKLAGPGLKLAISEVKALPGEAGNSLLDKADALTDFVVDKRLTTPNRAEKLIQKSEANIQQGLKKADNNLLHIDEAEAAANPDYSPYKEPILLDSNTPEIKNRIANLREQVANQATPKKDIQAIDDVIAEFDAENHQVDSPSEALAIARNTAKFDNAKQFGELKGAEVEARKAIEQGIRDHVKGLAEAAGSKVNEDFANQSRAITAKKVLEKRAIQRSGSANLGFPAMALAALEFAHSGSPIYAAMAGALPKALKSFGGIRTGITLNELGRAAGAAGKGMESITPSSNMLRAALLSALEQRMKQEQGQDDEP